MATLGASSLIGAYGLTWAGTQGTGAAAGTVIGGGFGAMSLGVGFLVVGGLIDAKVSAKLFGGGRNQWQPPRLLGLPVQSGEAGQPRVWAIGRRVRVPAHVMWQTEKRIEVRASSGMKATPSANMQRVLVDAAVAVNDRQTLRIVQLVGQGKLLFWSERNLVAVRTSGITVTESGGNLVLSMVDNAEPSWADRFAVNDLIELQGFVIASGPDINDGYWRVVSVTAHTASVPSVLTLAAYGGQALVGLSATAGSSASPAQVFRVDDAIAAHTVSTVEDPNGDVHYLRITPSYGTAPDVVFQRGDYVALDGFAPAAVNGVRLKVFKATSTYLDVHVGALNLPYATTTATAGTSTDAATVSFWSQPMFSTGLFPASFVPADHYYQGTLTQDPDATIEAEEGAGNVPAYRGVAYQVLDDFDVTAFGGSIPPMLEALVDVDASTTWGDALVALCRRHGLDPAYVDVSGVDPQPFEGMFTRGAIAGATVLQPLLLAGQIATQERDGVLVFFDIENADVVQIENGTAWSDLIISNGEDNKLAYEDMSPEDLPSSVGVRHQDPDNYYADGYQIHGSRHPSANGEANVQEVDLSNVVLTAKQAKNLATTLMRRAYVNSRQVRCTLSAAYMHVQENDLLTVTDDNGEDVTIRVIRRDIGANYLVQVTGVVEDVDLAVTGSPVQTGAGRTTTPPVQFAPVVGRVLDIPPLRDVEGQTPGLLVAAAPQTGGPWAGCNVYRSTNAGADWTLVGSLSQQAGVGVTESTLVTASPSETLGSAVLTWDADNNVTVEFDSLGTIPINTTNEASVEAGLNWFLLDSGNGDFEIIGARDVLQNTATNLTFSYLLRGLRGTIAGCAADRPAGAHVTCLSFMSQNGGTWLDMEGLETSTTQEYRFVPPGLDVSDVESVPVQALWRNCRPFPVRDVTKAISGTTSVRFTVDHWTRKALPPGSVGPYPLDETYEEFRFDLWNASRSAIAYTRTVTSRGTGSSALRDKWVEFTAAEVNAAVAGYTLGPGETFWLDVVQVGDYGDSPSNLQEL